jgi:PAS domain S-box-containing protein
MNSKTKLLIALFIGSLLALAALSGFAVNRMHLLSDTALAIQQKTLLDDYDTLIKSQVQSAVSLLAALEAQVAAGKMTDTEAKKRGADLIRQLRYQKEGYFWIDTRGGTNIVLLGNPSEGKNRIDLQDTQGKYIIREIIAQGCNDGGGYTDYRFPKAGSATSLPKRGYSLEFKPWGWIVGTGNYIDDINRIAAEQNRTAQLGYTTTIGFFSIASLVLILTFLGIGFMVSVLVNNDKKTIELAEDNLQKSEAHFRQIFEESPDAYTLLFDGVIIDCNKATERLLHCGREQICGQVPELFSPEFQPDGRRSKDSTAEKIAEALSSGMTTFEWMHHRPDGTKFWAEISLSPMTIQGRQVLFTILRDISERKQVEGTLQKQEQFIHSTLDGLSAHICVIDAQGKIVITNRPWNMFAQENSAAEGSCGAGSSYLKACTSASEADASEIDEFATAVTAIIDGTLSEFVKEYPCHSPTAQRWFICRINRFTVSEEHFAVISHENITERKLSEIRLSTLSRVVEQSPVTIVITDTRGTIEYVNPHFTELTGYTAEEAIGQNPRILKSGQTPPVVFEKLWSTIKAGDTWEGDILNKGKNDNLFWEHAVISALRDDTGVTTHFLAIKEDVTEKRKIMEQLIEAKEKADAATQAKSSFLATMSHEIRTPMNGVIGMTSLLLDTELTDEQRDFADIVRKSGDNLLSLINDILDFSKIEAGKMDLEILDFDLRPTLEDTAELLGLRASDKGLELICRIDPAVPSYLRGDPGRLRQIITNLVGNAIKFTHQGEVVISAKLAAEKDTEVTILFEVHDTGIGIPTERCDAVFTAFTQVDGSTTRKYGGTGLGLAICKQLAELMGGEIGVTSEEGNGSTFWFTCCFEKQPAHVTEASKTSEVLKYADITGSRILVVDDNATNRKLITTLLDHWGCRHEVAIDGVTGLASLSAAADAGDPFKLALLDQEMPNMDGLELARRIKADPLLASTLLIMVTSLGQRGDAGLLEKIGFAGYLAKPLRQSQLHDCIALVLGRNAVETHCNASQQQCNASLPLPQGIITRYTVSEYAEQGVRILLAEDNIINQKVAQNMLNKQGYKADVVANGQEAVRALEMIDYDLVLMDCLMPEMDGFEATAMIRSAASKVKNHAVPIIAMTANAMQGDREKCLESGMDDYLAKPVKKEELTAALARWLLKREPA